jgi:hypothetical protein
MKQKQKGENKEKRDVQHCFLNEKSKNAKNKSDMDVLS